MIEFTEEQKEVMNYLLAQVENENGHNTIVSGSGGVGKSSIICELIVRLLSRGIRVAAGAMTGKATAVLRGKIYEAIHEQALVFPPDILKIETISKMTKTSRTFGIDGEGQTIYTNTWKDPKEFDYDVLFIDELSMVPQFISQWWLQSKARVFGFGDECQLPEVMAGVGEEIIKFKKDLDLPTVKYTPSYGVKVLTKSAHLRLYTVLRADNEIAHLSNDLRDFSQNKKEVLGKIKKWADVSESIHYTDKLGDLEIGADWQIIAYTNKMCDNINRKLAIGEEYPELSDKIILLDNINPLQKYNGDVMMFGEFIESIALYNYWNEQKLYICMKWYGRMPRKDSPNPIERNFYEINRQFEKAYIDVHNRRLANLNFLIESLDLLDEEVWKINKIIIDIKKKGLSPSETLQEIIDEIQNFSYEIWQDIVQLLEPLPRLYCPDARFGYCLTCHKSQGSEFEKVCYLLEKFDKHLLYTGITRAKKELKVIDLTEKDF